MAKFYASTSPDVEEREIINRNLSRRLAGECMVLLENDGALPIGPNGKIALYGSGARKTVRGGTGSGEVNTRDIVNVEQGFLEAGYEITSTNWLNRQDENVNLAYQAYRNKIDSEAAQKGVPPFTLEFDNPFKEPAPVVVSDEDIKESDTDTAIYVISRNSGEGADCFCKEGDYLLFKEEQENIEKLAKAYAKCIVVLNIGGVMDVKAIRSIEGVNALLLMTQLGNLGGNALVDVISGEVNPSGKTADTWASDYMDYPSSARFSHNESVHDEYYEDGIFVGYRYFDSFDVMPEYCFGYGKSYTEFEIGQADIEVSGNKVMLKVPVSNVGHRYAGKEVVQVYVSAPAGRLAKPYQELVRYQKTKLLAPGEQEVIEISFGVEELASYSQEYAAWMLEEGEYIVRVGNSSADTVPVAALVLGKTISTVLCKNAFALDTELEEIVPEEIGAKDEDNELLKITINPATIPVELVLYQDKRQEYVTDKIDKITMSDILSGNATVEEMVAQLTVEEMAELCVGTMRGFGESAVGNASHCVPGAAGDTSSALWESRGVRNMILADGPAGLRLQPHFKTDKEGNLLPGGDGMGGTFTPFDSNLKEEETTDYYQYCTAIPIGWALAQSWNTQLMEEAGDMIGSEMEQFHVDLWLAPALNIHRNPLCGRNFEYFSEDPYVSGKAAAALTKGVQKHKGKGTTIKHFAANNQEDNRYFVNAHISERAIREIYLKGFEIAVKESQPLSIMTSYNLLNGVHTANAYDLIQMVAREEWGFAGTIMTDWFTSQDVPMITGKFEHHYPISASTGCIYAGNDLQMPGCQQNVDDIIEAVKTGKEKDGYRISLADLQFNAANILRVIAKTMI